MAAPGAVVPGVEVAPLADLNEIYRGLEAMSAPGEVIELRIFRPGRGAFSVYFDHTQRDSLAQFAIKKNLEGVTVCRNINTIKREFLERQFALEAAGKKARALGKPWEPLESTKDPDIAGRDWLPIDIDPAKPNGSDASATDEEKAAVFATASAVTEFLDARGWPEPIVEDSGNGAHLLYRINLPNDDAARELVRAVFAGLAAKFNNAGVTIDTSMCNAARLLKLPGTVANKGPHTAERPHRLSRLLGGPKTLAACGLVSREQLEDLARDLPMPAPAPRAVPVRVPLSGGSEFDIEAFMARGGIKYHKRDQHEGGDRWHLDFCPFKPDHRDGHTKAVIMRLAGGALAFKCQSDSCVEHDWHALRELVDGPREKRNVVVPLRANRAAAAGAPAESGDDLPEIFCAPGELPRMASEAVAALLRQAEIDRPYMRAGALVRLGRIGDADLAKDRRGVKRQAGSLTIMPCTVEYLALRLPLVANWAKWNIRADAYKPTDPPSNLMHSMIGAPDLFEAVPLLAGVIEAPTLRPDGSLLDVPGYDEATGLFYDPGGVVFPKVLDAPTREDAIAALAEVKRYLRGYPFADLTLPLNDGEVRGVWLSVALSAFLTAVCRGALPAAPMHLFDAPLAGSGKSLATDAVSIVATGREAAAISQIDDDNEERKQIFSSLLAGDPVLAIDNIEHPIGSPALSTLLTQKVMKGRILGLSKDANVSTNCLVMGSGNNTEFKGDIWRRVMRCRIVHRDGRPEARHFDFDLKADVKRDRPQIVADLLTVLRAFVVAGKPEPEGVDAYGSYKEWSALVRYALIWLGEADPLLCQAGVKENDSKVKTLRAVFTELYSAFGSRAMTAREILGDVRARGVTLSALADALDEIPRRGDLTARALGNWLSKHKEKVESGLRLTSPDKKGHDQMWRVAPADKPAKFQN